MGNTLSGIRFWTGIVAFILAVAMLLIFLSARDPAFTQSAPPANSVDIAEIRSRLDLSDAERAWIEAHPVIRTRIGDWPPFMSSGNQPSGISLDYLRVISQTTGLTFSYLTGKDIGWSESLQAIEERRLVDLIPVMQPSKERERFLLFTDAYQILPWVIITRDDEEFTGGMEDLAGKTVSIQEGFVLQAMLAQRYPEIKLLVSHGDSPALAALMDVSAGKAQATITALPVAAYFISRYGLANLKIAAPAQLGDMKLAMGVRKDWPELVAIMDKVFAAMSRKDVAAINNAWLSPHYEYGLSPKIVLGWTLSAAFLVIAVILSFIWINRMLKKQVAERTRELNKELDERKAAEAALQESEGRFRSLVENSPFPMVLETVQGKLLYLNTRFTESFGYTLEDFPDLETGFRLSYPDPAYRAMVAARWRAAAEKAKKEGGPVLGGECSFTCKDGSVKPLDITGMPMGDKVVTVLVDLTERKKAEELMVQTEKMLFLGGLAAGMAHEINNPLGIILAAAQNAQRRLSPDIPKNRSAAEALGLDLSAVAAYTRERGVLSYLESIREAGSRAARIVRNMLDFSRQSESRRTPRSVNVLLDKTVELAANDYDLKKNYDFKTIEIIRQYDPQIGPVPVTETEIEQVFLNVLKNAAQAMAGGLKPGVRGRIVLRTMEEPGGVRVEIEDNGPGMTSEERRRAFEPFFTTKPPGMGTGLGLSVSFFIVARNHGGEMRLESAPGGGTLCVIRLPNRKAEDAPAHAAQSPQTRRDPGGDVPA